MYHNPFIRRKVVPGRRVTLKVESTLSSVCMTKTLPLLTELPAFQARRHGDGGRGVGGVRMLPPRSQKGPPDGIVKDFKRYKNNVGDGRIDNFSAFPAVWKPQISNFDPERACPRTPQKLKQSSQPSRIRRFTWESRIPTWLQSEHGYPDFEEQLSQANEQRNIFLLNYHNICHEINKPLNLDI